MWISILIVILAVWFGLVFRGMPASKFFQAIAIAIVCQFLGAWQIIDKCTSSAESHQEYKKVCEPKEEKS